MNKSTIKALYFDLDHTLWDFEENSAQAFKTLFKQYEIGLKLDAFLEVYVPNNTAYWRLYREGKIDKEKFSNFALHLTEVNTNPVKYI